MVELAPLAVPETQALDVPPGPDLNEILPAPEAPPPVDIPPAPRAIVSTPEARQPAERRPNEANDRKARKAPPASTPRTLPQTAEVPSAIAAEATPMPASAALPTWKGALLRHLDRHKRYPPEAQRVRHHGITYVRFTMSRDGRVMEARIERATGFASLDREGIELLYRAQPLPSLPPDQPGQILELIVPIEFVMRR